MSWGPGGRVGVPGGVAACLYGHGCGKIATRSIPRSRTGENGSRGTYRDWSSDMTKNTPTAPHRGKEIPSSDAATLYPRVMRGVVLRESGCLERVESVNPKTGYSHVTLMTSGTRRYYYAHRVVWTHLCGPIPAGMTIDHLCKNTACVNVAHLEPVSPRENVLRSGNPAAKNATKTHCIRGHELPPPQERDGRQKRRCLECEQARYMERRERGLPPGDPRHGTNTGYTSWSCRCDACREGARLRYLEKKRAS